MNDRNILFLVTYWIRQSQSDKTVLTLRRSPQVNMHSTSFLRSFVFSQQSHGVMDDIVPILVQTPIPPTAPVFYGG